MLAAWRRQVAGAAAATLRSAGGRLELTQHGASCAQGGGSELGTFLRALALGILSVTLGSFVKYVEMYQEY